MAGGRAGEGATVHLAEQLENAGLLVERFKTGTPPRIDGRSVQLERLEIQMSEIEAFDYSWSSFWETSRRHNSGTRHPGQLPCWITHLEERGKNIIAQNLGLSAMYGGAIGTRGPRYCPSVEDKVVKFPDADRHQLFLEPEGQETSELYVNGLSTSLPPEVQLEVLRSIPGLEAVRMTRPGYAIEYDYFPPTQLDESLRVRSLQGLYFAGQINGTTGYEEAAGQGAVAGLNAARFALGQDPIVFGRESSYIGVLVDDLVTKGVDEPYRLFTSRSEFRLTVRQDNAVRRLGAMAAELGLLNARERAVVERIVADEDRALELAHATSITPAVAAPILEAARTAPIPHPVRISELSRRQNVDLRSLLSASRVGEDLRRESVVTADLQLKYAGYFERERIAVEKLRRMGHFSLVPAPDYSIMRSLSLEARQKLTAREPRTLAQAASIPGVGPADLQSLVIEVERQRRVASGVQGAS
jgi:tRNA uridine 5-carboxymethylaminomethyl modification enzyme